MESASQAYLEVAFVSNPMQALGSADEAEPDLGWLAEIAAFGAVILIESVRNTHMAQELKAAEATAIAREAMIYGFPIVEGYKTLYKQAVDESGSDYKAPFNQVGHARNVATPEDTWVVTPNSDTPYSFAWLDLRSEPVVITMPKVEDDRYYSAQLIDLSTFNFAYLGTRSFGNEGGDFLITEPGWEGETPAGIKAVIPCETQLFYALFRTQLFNPGDITNVHAIQDGYAVQPLSAYLDRPAPATAPAIAWPKPGADMTESARMFTYLNFLLQFIPPHPSEAELLARFAKLGIAPGTRFDPDTLSAEMFAAVTEGINQALDEDLAGMVKRINAGTLSSGDLFGTRAFLQNNAIYRFTGAKLGIYGNSRDEAFYPAYFADTEGKQPDASQHRYVMRFAKGQLPPAQAFWSLTMYDAKSQLLVANPLKRYLLNSAMENTFKLGSDGSVTFYMQKDSPGTDEESNWLPAPNGPFYLIMRIYIPKPDTFNGRWQQPGLERLT